MSDPKALTPAEIPAFIAQLKALGYTVVPPIETPPVEAIEPVEVDWDAIVLEAQELVKRLQEAEIIADERCMGTPLNDPELERYRHEATRTSSRLADAEEDLRKAIADRKLCTGR